MDLWIFLIFFGACGAAAASGALFPTGEWYKSLDKPNWTPPDWVFPIAWTIFYFALAFAGTRVASLPENKYALAFWSLHIALNTLWTPVFFGSRNLKAGMVIILLMWLATAGMIFHCSTENTTKARSNAIASSGNTHQGPQARKPPHVRRAIKCLNLMCAVYLMPGS